MGKFDMPSAVQSGRQAKAQDKPKEEFYRFNMKMPIECKEYLQEMAYQSRKTITQYLSDLVLADMDAHPNWRDTLDAANKPQ